MEMGEQYGLPDLRQLMGRRTLFPAVPQAAAEQLHSNRDLTTGQHYEMMMGVGVGRTQVGEAAMLPLAVPVVDFHHHPDHHSTSPSAAASASASAISCGLEKEACIGGGDGGNGRWPRQETLTLLEIRSRLDPKFKEANQKGPLWDEVSRIMGEEHGYQRSGKKCREKFENLYKYYKKTKESKAGRQDGKHYRFFRQLEALYGGGDRETTTTTPPPPPPPPPLSASQTHQTHFTEEQHSFQFQPTTNDSNPQLPNQLVQRASQSQQKHCESSLSLSNSSDFDTSSSEENDLSHKKGRRKSWKAKIRDFVDSQMRKLVVTQEAWLEKMLKTLESKEQERMSREEAWRKEETTRLAREYKFWAHERAWVEARDAALMEALHKFTGRREPNAASSPPEELVATTHDNSENQNENGSEALNDCTINNNKNVKRRKENSRTRAASFHNHLHLPSEAPSPSNSNARTAVHDSCFRYMMAEEEPLWENYDVKLNKGSENS
ncbi:trihelix transcription factor PTL-like [Macadamia integrifolia]|uniref:trihelix transcription factor PTL-like n=1 Tax=Macadamia integrifolia TaxID=60698 RepID=UPI001C4F84A9|nr:trihelix transcription factor PTL-like [Macadamia integrifolia]XP_042510919.1 trihelix transcription factor PTL-like [Macadamia integrifolia]